MTVEELRRESGMSQREFAAHYGIPVRTLQQWEQGKSTPAPYVLAMMEKLRPAPTDVVVGEGGTRKSTNRRRRPQGAREGVDRFAIPERHRWKVCIERPFPNCERVHPIQQWKVRELLDDVLVDPAVKRVTVFGSSVTQRCHRGSDVDVYIETENKGNPIRAAHDFPLDVWTNHTADGRLMRTIEETGVVVYG